MSSHVLSSMQVDSVQVSHLRICLLKRVVVSTESEDSARPLYSVNVNHIIHSIKRTITTMKITGNLSSFHRRADALLQLKLERLSPAF